MNRSSRQLAASSKVSVKSETLIPREDKATNASDDPFAAFSEWTSEADEKAYSGLWSRR
jgi:antitoxin PrlF